jgi:anti-sigma-K factor RskA
MGLTLEAETAEVVKWAKQYPEVTAEIEAIQAGLENYAQTYSVTPDASVKEKLFASINIAKTAPVIDLKTGNNATAKVYSISPVWKYAVAASVALLIGSMILNYIFYNKYQTANTELASSQLELQQQKDLADNMNREMGVMTDKNALPVSLAGMPDVPDAAARIYWMTNTKDVYIDPSNLPQAPAGKQYQFWAIVDGVPVNGGIITTQINGKTVHIQKMKSFGSAQAFAVSLEDAGPEKPAPTKVMVMGKI